MLMAKQMNVRMRSYDSQREVISTFIFVMSTFIRRSAPQAYWEELTQRNGLIIQVTSLLARMNLWLTFHT